MDKTQELEELRAVVAKLPKTADGVVVTPGMTMYARLCDGRIHSTKRPAYSTDSPMHPMYWYSTREAIASKEIECEQDPRN